MISAALKKLHHNSLSSHSLKLCVLHITHAVGVFVLIILVLFQMTFAIFISRLLPVSANTTYSPDPYCLYHVLGSLWGDFGGNGYNWDPNRTNFAGWSNATTAVADRFEHCARVMAADPTSYSLYSSPAPSVSRTNNKVSLTNFHFTFSFPFDTLATPVSNADFYGRRAFLMSFIEGEGGTNGKLLDETHCISSGTKCADGWYIHTKSLGDLAKTLFLNIFYVGGACSGSTPETTCTIIDESQLADYGTDQVYVYSAEKPKLRAWPFAAYSRVPGGSYLADTLPPGVSITSPNNGQTVSGSITIQASTTDPDNSGIKQVVFSADGNTIATITNAPYQTPFNTASLTDGSHTLTATVSDYNDVQSTANLAVDVLNGSSLTLSSVSPTTGSIAGGATLAITGVGFLNGATVTIGGTPATGVVINSSTSITATAPAHASGSVDVTVTNSGGGSATKTAAFTYVDSPPTVSLVSPISNATLGGSVTLKATASDDGSISKIEFYQGTTLLSTDTTVNGSGYYTYVWDTTAVPNGSYILTAKAYDNASQTTTTTNTTVTISNSTASGPSTPTNLSASAPTPTTVDLSWTANTAGDNVTRYNVVRDGIQIAQVNAPATTYTDTTVTANTTYSYQLSATNGVGTSALTAGTSVTTPNPPDTTPPTAPTNLNGTYSSLTGNVSLTWTASTDDVGVASYTIKRNGVVIATGITDTSWADSSVSQGQAYTYKVVARDGAGNSSANSTGFTIAIPDTTPPTAPTNLSGVYDGNNVNLTWTASTDNIGVASYTIKRNGVAIVSGVTSTSYSDLAVPQGQTYVYTAQAVDASANASADSASSTVTVDDATPPTTPTGLAANYDNSVVTVNWLASSDNVNVASYTLYRDGNLYVSGITDTSYDDVNLSLGTTYSYQVQAVDSSGNPSAQSTAVSVSIPSTPPPPPPPSCKTADINCDGTVNILDLSILLNWYGRTYDPADINKDGVVNILDLSILLSRYGS